MYLYNCALSASLLSLVFAKATVYLIRHGEKPPVGNDLSTEGQKRAQCLRNVFGKGSQYNIRYIMAQTPKSGGGRQRPYNTVEPLAKDLGITIDTSCDRDDSYCVARVVHKYGGSGNILICWEHDALSKIVHALGDHIPPSYPGANFGLIWTDPASDSSVTSTSNEDCPGLGS